MWGKVSLEQQQYQVGDKVEVQGEATSISFDTQPWLRHSWYLASIIKVEVDELDLYEYLVHFDGFGSERDTWVFDYNVRKALDTPTISLEEQLSPGIKVEVIGQIEDNSRTKPQSYWEAEVVQDKGASVLVKYFNTNWNIALQDRLEVSKAEIRRAGEPFDASIRRESIHEASREHFHRKLSEFMRQRGTPIAFIPTISSKQVDLFDLYMQVTNFGGIERVNSVAGLITKIYEKNKCYDSKNPSGALALKKVYLEYLFPFEQSVFVKKEDRRDERFRNGMKKQSFARNIVPTNQVIVSEVNGDNRMKGVSPQVKRNKEEDENSSDGDYRPKDDGDGNGTPKRKAITDNDRSCKVCGDYGVVHATHSESMDKYFREIENYNGEPLSEADSLCRRCYQHWYQYRKRLKEKSTKHIKGSPLKDSKEGNGALNALARCRQLVLEFKPYSDFWRGDDRSPDLQTCLTKLDTGRYNSPKEFADEVKSVFAAKMKRSEQSSAIYLTASSLLQSFSRQFEASVGNELHFSYGSPSTPEMEASMHSPLMDEPDRRKKMKTREIIIPTSRD